MDALAVSAISLIVPYLAKGAEEFAKEAGKDAYAAVKALVSRLELWWGNNKMAGAAVDEIPTNPEDSSEVLSRLLTKELTRDGALAADLQQLLQSVAPHVEVIQKMEVGQGIVGADIERFLKGSLRVSQEIKDAKDVTGFTAKTMG